MKAWMVSLADDDKLGSVLVHADTRGQAKSKASHFDGYCDYCHDFVYLQAVRCKKLDDKPLNADNAATVFTFANDIDEDGNPYEGEICTYSTYINECDCPICTGGKQ